MFSFQGASELPKKLNEVSSSEGTSVNFFRSFLLVEISGIEPLTSCLQGRRSPSWAKPPYPSLFLKWWAKMDSNHRPHDYQSCALASWAIGPYPYFFWWRVPGSNRWPPACKAGALPAELTPQFQGSFVFKVLVLSVPSKLNNVKLLTLCTDLRTLQDKSSSILKSP